MKKLSRILACLSIFSTASLAGEVKIVNVEVTTSAENTYRFSVTLEHADTGWDHYADGWEVVSADGTIIGKRTLFHPHVNEQPFTRSLGDVHIDKSKHPFVFIRAHDSVHGYTRTQVKVKLD